MKEQKITAQTFHDASALLLREMMEEEEANTDQVELSPEFRARMEGLLQDHKTEKVKKIRRRRRLLTAAAMIIIALFTWLTFDVKARAAVAEWFESVIENVFHYSFSGSVVEDALPTYRLGWLPEGGWIKEEQEESGRHYHISVLYGPREKPENAVTLSYGRFDEGTAFNIDSQGQEVTKETITVRGQEIEEFYTEYYKDYSYVWMNEEEHLYFLIWSNYDHDTNLLIIEDVLKGMK